VRTNALLCPVDAKGFTQAVHSVFLHCSASDHAHHDNVETLRQWHVLDRGWSDIGYHFLINFDGELRNCLPLSMTPAEQKGRNTGSIAICLSGGQNGKANAFTAKQYDTLLRLCTAINQAYAGRVTLHSHHEVANKAYSVYDCRYILNLDDNGVML
jgi:N-acetyl-anhydromuramyl-L-alanine amidase AmpD